MKVAKIDPRLEQIRQVVNSKDSDSTKNAYRKQLEDFLEWFDSSSHTNLTRAAVQDYRANSGKPTPLLNQALSAIRALVAEMADSGLISHNQAATITSVKNIKYTPELAGRNISPDEIAALLDVCVQDKHPSGLRDAALIALIRVTGMRRAEVARLNVSDLDTEESSISVLGKGNKRRISYFDESTKRYLEDWLDFRGIQSGPLFCRFYRNARIGSKNIGASTVYYILDKRIKQAGVDHLTPHDFRRTIIGDMLDNGEDISTVARVVGHSDVSTTARYDRRPEERKKQAAIRIDVPYIKELK